MSVGEPGTAARREAPDGVALVLLAALAGFAYMLIAPLTLMDGDTGWHLAAGAWIVDHGRVPTADPFSYTAYGRPWVAHEWLSEVAMVAAWRAGGWSGLILLFAASLATLIAIVGWHLLPRLGPRGTAVALALLGYALAPSMIGRPHMIGWPILAAWVAVLLRAREAGRAPHPGWAALMLVWANAHASFMLGLGLAAVFALDALVAMLRRPGEGRFIECRPIVIGWGLFGLLCGVAAVLTPAGVHGIVYPFQVSGLALLPYIAEWRPLDFTRAGGFELWLLAGLFAVLVRPARVAPVRLLLLLGLFHMALTHMRYASVFAIVATLVMAAPIGHAWHARRRPLPRVREWAPLAAMALVLAGGLGAYRLAEPIARADSPGVPDTALRRLPPALKRARVFNEYSFGGPLILAGVRPFIDGRSDMYGDAFTLEYFRIARGDWQHFRAADARWHFGWTMLPPANPLVARLDAAPEWRRAYADAVAVIHVRRAR